MTTPLGRNRPTTTPVIPGGGGGSTAVDSSTTSAESRSGWGPRGAGNTSRVSTPAGPDAQAAAKAFSDARTPAAFAAWAEASPAGAGLWLKKVAQTAGNTEAVAKLDTILQSPKGKGADVGALFSKVHDTKVAGETTAAATQPTYYQPVDPNKKLLDPPALTGKLSVENGQPVLTTSIGQFNLSNVNGLDSQHMLGGLDVQAFNGRTVTVRGWPDAEWKPGTKSALAVEEFSPGTSPDFISGRVVVQNDEVTVQVRADKKIKITDPQLAATLKNYDMLGVVLPGAMERNGDQLTYSQKPGDYYILAGFAYANNPTRTGDNVNFNLQLAHGKQVPCDMPAESFDGTQREQRHYVFGHFAEGKFVAAGLTQTAGTAGLGYGGLNTNPRPSTTFIERAVPVVPEIFSQVDARFAPK